MRVESDSFSAQPEAPACLDPQQGKPAPSAGR